MFTKFTSNKNIFIQIYLQSIRWYTCATK